MSVELKGALALAYASGLKPRFMTVLPGGWDEAWRLGGLMLVLPIVPPNAPADRQYALRLRRDAMTEGRCPNCDVVPSMLDAVVIGDSVPVGAVKFDHKRRCSARDEHVIRLPNEYIESLSALSEAERLEAANSVVRQRIAELRESPSGVEMVRPDSESIATRILDELTPPYNVAQPCPHLITDPYQTWNVLIAEKRWRCDQCWAYFEERIREGFRLNPIEEFTCDICRRYASKTLGPMVLRVDTFVVRGGVCGGCADRYQSRGDSGAVQDAVR
jgi:hypothetical protein